MLQAVGIERWGRALRFTMATTHTLPSPQPLLLSAAFALASVALIVVALLTPPESSGDAMPDTESPAFLLDVGPVGSRGNPLDNSIINPIRPNTR